MYKKTLSYKDLFTNEPKTEDVYFHLSKADLIELEFENEAIGGIKGLVDSIKAPGVDPKKVIRVFKDLISRAYGRRNEAGGFVKSEQMSAEFMASEAYSEFFMGLMSNTNNAVDFFNKVVPVDLQEAVAKEVASGLVQNPATTPSAETTTVTPAYQVENRLPTGAEIDAMSEAELVVAMDFEPVAETKDERPAWLREGRSPSKDELKGAAPALVREAMKLRAAGK